MSTPSPAPSAPSAPEAVALHDQAVTFLESVAPPSMGDRTRAFAALLRALTTPTALR